MAKTTIKERPILFSGEMVRAILEGRKTQTRRVVKPQPTSEINPVWINEAEMWQWESVESRRRCPYGKPGDRLWVRENGWQPPETSESMIRAGADTWPNYIYDADCNAVAVAGDGEWCRDHGWRRRPSIHMPRWASRITLEVTDVRVERLHEISKEDVVTEGFPFHSDRDAFSAKWDEFNSRRGFPWDGNPWVWVVGFRHLHESEEQNDG